MTSTAALWELAEQAKQAGFPLSIHAIGDLAVREVIEYILKKNGKWQELMKKYLP